MRNSQHEQISANVSLDLQHVKGRQSVHLVGVTLFETIGPMKQPKPIAANKRPSVVELSPKLCMLGNVLKRTCKACCTVCQPCKEEARVRDHRSRPFQPKPWQSAETKEECTCRLSEAPHTMAPLAFMRVRAAASLHAQTCHFSLDRIALLWALHFKHLARMA